MSDIKNTPNQGTADIMTHNASPQDAYYRFKLMEEKLRIASASAADLGAGGAQVKEILGQLSEKERIELGILRKLMRIKESSPEFAQLVSLTGSEDRMVQAERLGKAVYSRAKSEAILSFYTPDKETLKAYVGSNINTGSAARAEGTSIWGGDDAEAEGEAA